MNRRMKLYIGWLGVLFALFCWAACSEEGGDTPDPTPDENTLLESVRLRIGASGTVETRNYGGDENAVEGEFINTLRVFIVDENNTIEKVILANDSLDTEEETLAEAGNLTHFTTTVDITPGRKTIYAFANMDNANVVGQADGTTMESILAELKEGGTWNAETMSAYAIADPASEINAHLEEVTKNDVTEWHPANDYYIPMSVRQEVDLTTNGQNVEIALVRLVGKVQASIMNRQGSEVEISKIAMGEFYTSVALFEGENISDVATANYEKEFDSPITVQTNAETATTLPVFYINETVKEDETPFTISLTIGENDMSGETKTTSIPRNHVLPLLLSLSNVNLELDITAYVAPIGGYPVNVSLADPSLTDVYHINLPEGCTFEITGKFTSDLVDETTAYLTVRLSDDSSSDNVVIIDTNTETTGAITIEGHAAALSGQSATLDYVANAQGSALRTTGSLVIHTVPLLDQGESYPVYNTRSLTDWLATPRRYEPIHLTTP